MIGCLRTRVCNQPIIALYFEFETVKFYNLGGQGYVVVGSLFIALMVYDGFVLVSFLV